MTSASTLIQLISHETMPNVLTALSIAPARIVSITSKNEPFADRVKRIEDAIRLAWPRVHPGCAVPEFAEPLETGDAASIERACATVESLCKAAGPGAVVNYTGGTKQMGIGAWRAASDMGVPSLYCDTPRGFVTGETAPLPTHLPMAELAKRLDIELVLAAHGLRQGTDYHITEPTRAAARLGRAAFDLLKNHPGVLRSFRWTLRKFCTDGRPAERVRRAMNEPLPADCQRHELAEFLDAGARCSLLKQRGGGGDYFICFPHTQPPLPPHDRLEEVLMRLEGGAFEAYVQTLLARRTLFTHSLQGVRPAGFTLDADFGETDFLAYNPQSLSLTLISCKISPPSLQHLESVLARRQRLGGRFARAMLCMEGPANREPQREIDRLKLLDITGVFGPDLEKALCG